MASSQTMTTTAAIEVLDQNARDGWFHGVFECLNDAVFIHDTETGAIMEVNRRACEMYGCEMEDMRRLSVGDLSANVSFYT